MTTNAVPIGSLQFSPADALAEIIANRAHNYRAGCVQVMHIDGDVFAIRDDSTAARSLRGNLIGCYNYRVSARDVIEDIVFAMSEYPRTRAPRAAR